eukprot:749527-Hanusia_phi.AAC.2
MAIDDNDDGDGNGDDDGDGYDGGEEVDHTHESFTDWKKKKDGKAVREDHEKLKIDGVERYLMA